MRMSELFGRTLRSPSSALRGARAMAERAGLARFHADGIVWLPLGHRALGFVRADIVHILPASQWLALPPGEEGSGWRELIEAEVQSYRQLRFALAADRRTLWAPGSGVLSPAGGTAALQTASLLDATASVQDTGKVWCERLSSWAQTQHVDLRMGERGEDQLLVVLDQDGAARLILCPSCGYVAIEPAARFRREAARREAAEGRRLVPTPNAHTIDLLASALGIETSRTMKAVFLTDDQGKLTFVALPGNLEVSVWKLGRITGSAGFRPSTPEEIRAAGAEPGYASPIGLQVKSADRPEGVRVIVDASIPESANYVAGANQAGYHFMGVNYPRDFEATIVGDVAVAPSGAACSQCGTSMIPQRGDMVASWQVLPEAVRYADEGEHQSEARIGLGTVDLEAALLAVIESCSDAHGIGWPVSLAPYPVSVIDLKSPQVTEDVERELASAGVEALIDDRPVSAGVKLNDADLIGCPIRITVGTRSLSQGGVEVARRLGKGAHIVPTSEVSIAVRGLLDSSYVNSI